MRFEAEVITEEILPAIRSIIATRLHQEYGLTQEEIANRLEVTQPAVSQYLSQSRADQDVVEKLRDDPQVDIMLDDASGNAAKGKEFSGNVSQVIETVRDKGLLKEKFQDTKKL